MTAIFASPERPRPMRRFGSDGASVTGAAAILREGGLLAFPTETVYGLGADARSAEAVAGVYGAKERPRFNPLIAHVASLAAALAEGEFGPEARALAEAFWPGPLTLVVPASPWCGVCDLARAGLPSVALRVPAHLVALALLAEAGFPVAAPSANRSGRISPTEAGHVAAELEGRIDGVMDGGPSAVGLESTIVACLDVPRLLRAGGVARAEIEKVLGRPLAGPEPRAGVISPGMLRSHYAPEARLRLDAIDVLPGEAVLDFGRRLFGSTARVYADLSSAGSLVEAAANLFGFLRRLDRDAEAIAVAPIPRSGLGEAINDRLARAAAPRWQFG